jgi:hypothetical protein
MGFNDLLKMLIEKEGSGGLSLVQADDDQDNVF